MKQAYSKPSTEVIDIKTETQLMALSADESLPGTSYGGEGTGKEADATGRRGEWGNLWAQE